MNHYRKDLIYKIEKLIAAEQRKIIGLFVIGAMLFLLDLIIPVLYRAFVDQVLVNRKWSLFAWIVLGYLGILILKVIGKRLDISRRNKLKYPLLHQLREIILLDELKAPISTIRVNIGNKKMKMNEDAEHVIDLYIKQKNEYPQHIVIAAVSFTFMLWNEWHMALIAIFSIPVTVWLDTWLSQRESVLNEKNRINMAEKESWLKEDIQCWKEKKLWQLEPEGFKEFSRFQDLFTQHYSRWINYWAARVKVIPDMKNEFVMKLGVYFVGGFFVAKGKMSVGSLLVFISYYQYFINALQNASNDRAEIKESSPSVDRVFQGLHAEPIQNHSMNPLKNISISEIRWSEISFHYPNQEEEQLRMPKGRMVKGKVNLIQGISGCGKTTFYRLLLQYYDPQQGKIELLEENNANPIAIKDINPYDWYQNVSCVMQDSILFSGTLKDNLLFAKPDATEEEMMQCLVQAGLKEFVESTSEGLEMDLGKDGACLSGGQRQRVLLARALLKDSKVMLFDEVTSALDSHTEADIIEHLELISREKLVVWISHTKKAEQNDYVIRFMNHKAESNYIR